MTEENSTSEVVKEEPKDDAETENTDIRQETEEKPVSKPEVTTPRTEPVKPQKEPVVKDIEKTVVTPPAPSAEEINAEFETLIATGKEKMAAATIIEVSCLICKSDRRNLGGRKCIQQSWKT